MTPTRLTPESFAVALGELTARDTDLRAVVDRHGPPPMWERPSGFGTLVHIVLEQQVSLASAQAAFDRLRAARQPLTPASFLELDDAALLAIGFSRQKARYARALADALETGALDLEALETLDDDAVDAALQAIPGIGPWTTTIYRLMVLLRADAWPSGDIALAESLGVVKGLGRRPTAAELPDLAEGWRPWRAVAARILWHDYLERRAAARAERTERNAAPGRP